MSPLAKSIETFDAAWAAHVIRVEAEILLALDAHQTRSCRPIASLLADMPLDVLADIHGISSQYGLLDPSVSEICECPACAAYRSTDVAPLLPTEVAIEGSSTGQ